MASPDAGQKVTATPLSIVQYIAGREVLTWYAVKTWYVRKVLATHSPWLPPPSLSLGMLHKVYCMKIKEGGQFKIQILPELTNIRTWSLCQNCNGKAGNLVKQLRLEIGRHLTWRLFHTRPFVGEPSSSRLKHRVEGQDEKDWTILLPPSATAGHLSNGEGGGVKLEETPHWGDRGGGEGGGGGEVVGDYHSLPDLSKIISGLEVSVATPCS